MFTTKISTFLIKALSILAHSCAFCLDNKLPYSTQFFLPSLDIDNRPAFADAQYCGGFGNLTNFPVLHSPNVAMGNIPNPYSGGAGLKPPTETA